MQKFVLQRIHLNMGRYRLKQNHSRFLQQRIGGVHDQNDHQYTEKRINQIATAPIGVHYEQSGDADDHRAERIGEYVQEHTSHVHLLTAVVRLFLQLFRFFLVDQLDGGLFGSVVQLRRLGRLSIQRTVVLLVDLVDLQIAKIGGRAAVDLEDTVAMRWAVTVAVMMMSTTICKERKAVLEVGGG